MSIVLSVKNVSKSFEENQVLKNVSFEVEKGKIVGLLGPNGSGKTTLLKIINTLITDYTGEIRVCGNPLGIKSKELISFLPDNHYLREELKITETIDIYNDFFKDFDRSKAYEMLSSLKLDKKIRVSKLSKGMTEKLQLVLIMSRKAKLYIFDEPLAGVDPASRDYIIETIIKNFWDEGSILLSTHLISDVERILDRVIMIKEGQIVMDKDSDVARSESGKSVDAIFREVFKC